MMAVYNKFASLWIETCYKCGTHFGMSDATHQVAKDRRESFTWYCPSGHPQVYKTGETEETKLRRECNQLKQEQARLHDMIREEHDAKERADRRAAAMKGVATRMKNRIKAGVCPCCNRTFRDLARHMSSQHKDFDNVISLAEKTA